MNKFLNVLSIIIMLLFSIFGFYQNRITNILMPILGTLIIILLIIFEIKYDVPNIINNLILIFLFSSIIGGNFFDLYNLVELWDNYLHLLSPLIISLISLSIIMNLEPMYKLKTVFLFSLSFTIMILVFWEITEFSLDIIFDTNSQRYLDDNRVIKMGQEALYDTMIDLITDTIGALIGSFIGIILSIKNKTYLIKIKKRHNKAVF